METRPLEYFLRVSELGSINRAAIDLHLSQPALSRHISALEHELGATLFNRTRDGVNLTTAGELLASRARPILSQLSTLKEQVGEQASGHLSIGIPSSWHDVFTADFVSQLIAECPNVKLRVYEGVSNVLRDHMSLGLLDLAINPFELAPVTGYEQTSMVRESAVLVGTSDDALNHKNELQIADLSGQKIILPSRPNALRLQIENSLERKGLQFVLAAEADTVMLCLTMTRNGIARTVVPSCALHDETSRRGLSWSRLRGVYLSWMLFENSTRTHSNAVRQGKKIALKLVEEMCRCGIVASSGSPVMLYPNSSICKTPLTIFKKIRSKPITQQSPI